MDAILRWLNERLGAGKVWDTLFARKVPEARGLTGWLYTLGSAALFVFAVQFVTGVLLAMNYVPSPDHAYDSVRYIDERVFLGKFVRGVHNWGATFMVALVCLHGLRTFFMGAYKYPREATWMTGVALLLIVVGFGFSGYLLPWDQKAYWATAVGVNIAGQTPGIGPALAKILKGGEEMGAATLTRFYTAHVLILPALVALVIGVHLFLVIWHGISEPPGREKEEGLPFFPHAVFKDAVVWVVILAALAGLAVYSGADLEDMADPTDTTYNPRPEWYFLFLFEALKFFPGHLEAVAAVLLPGLAVAVLFALPILDRGHRRHPLDRPAPVVLALTVVAVLVHLTWRGYTSPLTNPIVKKDPAALAGYTLYQNLKCVYCHRIGGKGGGVGPDLDKIGDGKTGEWLERHFRDPQAVSPGSAMPKFNLLDDEISNLVAYIQSLGGGISHTEEAPKLFVEHCSGCHKLGGSGGEDGPDLSLIGAARDKTYIQRYVTDPSQSNPASVMPGFKGELTEIQIEDISRYLAGQGR